jgi:hypothetical protein
VGPKQLQLLLVRLQCVLAMLQEGLLRLQQ